ncbi:heterokaryon incompatibility protein-domain-containing protein [Rhypophila decipiens]|uniref:Heterokaryon incompatibility protein-domain-containing protein n=1 Tax=Rhypophila decipiens TaxID=261697 RepID=A0AAN6XVQ4_9PEZI|nr:heterokaryon incompatibility protein-domain-containing protein [Rhypophila decipiens]
MVLLGLTDLHLQSLDIPGLFAECVEILDITVRGRGFGREFGRVCLRLSLQKLRFIIWGEILGLLPGSDDGVCHPDAEIVELPEMRPALTELWYVVADAQVFTERLKVRHDASPQDEGSGGRFAMCRERLRESLRKEMKSWMAGRWSIHDLGGFGAVVDRITSCMDKLEGLTTGLGFLQAQQLEALVKQEVGALTDAASLHLLQDIGLHQPSSAVSSVLQESLNNHSTESQATEHIDKSQSLAPLPNLSTGLCEACSIISLEMILGGFRHALDFDQIQTSKDKCRFCAMMIHAYDAQICINHPTLPACDKTHRGRLTWAISANGPGTRQGLFKLDSSHYSQYVGIYVPEESSLFRNGTITQRDLQPADSPRNMRLLHSWLEDCRLNHDECRHGSYSGKAFDDLSSSATLPFRIIDVGPSDGSQPARLVTTTDAQTTGRYLTLSHCWGKISPTKTTQAIVAEWHVSLPEDDQLSKTFQDAIWLTRSLGERFLWIDSLCIVQDDPLDLEAQIGEMGAIFERSYCTIAAVDAKGLDSSGPDSGLFLSGRGDDKNPVVRLSLLDSTNGDTHEVFLQHIPTDRVYPFHIQLQAKAWHTRGWIFQEKELARRCIFFTQDVVAWRCNRYWETEQTGIPERREGRPAVLRLDEYILGGLSDEADHVMRRLWQRCVEEYSEKKLTYISDKGNALVGLEERLTARCQAAFHFGLLVYGSNQVLCSQLLWLSVPGRGRGVSSDKFFACPSWSWMAVNGQVKWTNTDYLVYPELLSEVGFGEKGELCISGPCRTVTVGPPIGDVEISIGRFCDTERWPPELHFGWSDAVLDSSTNFVLAEDGGERIGWIALDVAEEPVEIIASPVMRYLREDDEEEPVCIDFLALAKAPRLPGGLAVVGERERYNRVGRGRLLIGAFVWLEACRKHEFIVE